MGLKLCIIIIVAIFILSPLSIAQVAVIGELTHEKISQVGETYKGTITLSNASERPQEVKIYQSDYLFFSDGRHIYGEPGKDTRSNANWITFGPNHPVIMPRGSSEITYTVKVPDDKNLAGTYWSLIMVEAIPDNNPDIIQSAKGEVKINMQTLLRYGIQIITHIGDTGNRELNFISTKLLKTGENNILQVDVGNNGERLLRPSLWVELYDKNGNNMGRFEGGKLRVYPNTTVRYKVDLSKLNLIFNKRVMDSKLFSSIQRDLQSGIISDTLLQEFENNGISLSQKVTIATEDRLNGWLISDTDKKFVATKSGNGLDVHEQLKIPTGTYKVLMVADCGGDDIFGATYNLELKN